MSRGEYRGIHTVLVDETDFQALAPDSKLVWYTLKLQLGPSGLGTITAWRAVLGEQTGLTEDRLIRAVAELMEEGWLRKQENLFWLVNGLQYDPSVTISNEKHAKSVQKHLASLPKRAIVNAFAEEHEELAQPWPEIGIEYPHDTPTVPHAVQGKGKGKGKGIQNTEGSSLRSSPSEPAGSQEEQSRAGAAGRDQPNGAGPPPPEELPPDGEGRAEFCGAVRTHAWRGDEPRDPDWNMGRAVDVGRQLRVKWEADWSDVADRVRAVANMADRGMIDWLSPGEPFTLRIFNRDEERGVPLWRVAGEYLRREEERKAGPDALDGILEEQGAL